MRAFETVNDPRQQIPELRWPDFSDYGKHLQKFYELNGYTMSSRSLV